MRIETFEQLINVGTGRQFMVSKAHQCKARNRWQTLKINTMRKLILTLTIVIIHLSAFSQTNVSGFLTVNTVWDSLNDPYIITGNVLVTDSVKLTILPGTVVKFNSQKALQIEGELNVLGTDSAHVIFYS